MKEWLVRLLSNEKISQIFDTVMSQIESIDEASAVMRIERYMGYVICVAGAIYFACMAVVLSLELLWDFAYAKNKYPNFATARITSFLVNKKKWLIEYEYFNTRNNAVPIRGRVMGSMKENCAISEDEAEQGSFQVRYNDYNPTQHIIANDRRDDGVVQTLAMPIAVTGLLLIAAWALLHL